jgi:hypothetical protein
MAKMVLGSYTFEDNPTSVSDLMTLERKSAFVPTYSAGAFFSWGSSIVGKELELTWTQTSTDQYGELQTLLEADAAVVFNPQDGEGKTYNVEVTALHGEYWLYLSGTYRQNVTLSLLVLSEVS